MNLHFVNLQRVLIVTAASVALTLSSLHTSAQVVTNAFLLTYDGLGVANSNAVPDPYPGINSAATVTHFGRDQPGAAFEDVAFWNGLSPVNGYGNLTNVAIGPSGTPASTPSWGVISIAPNYPGNFVRIISFDIASLDNNDVDETIPYIVVRDAAGTIFPYVSASPIIAGDVDDTTHTHVVFATNNPSAGGAPIEGPPNTTMQIWWTSQNGRVAVDNVQFEIVGAVPPSTKLIVTLPGQTFTSGSGNSGTVTAQTAGTAFNLTLTAVNDSLTTDLSYSGLKTISYSGPGGSPTYTTAVTFTAGQATGVVTTLTKAETTTISAVATGLSGVASSSLTVGSGVFTKLQVLAPGETAAPGTVTGRTGTPISQDLNTAFNVTVNAVDANWNLVATNDSIHVVTTDPADTEPGDSVLVGGTKSFSITPATAGPLTVTATNTSNVATTPGISSTITVGASTVTYPNTLNYEGLGLANNTFIPDPYPGISAATVTHQAVTNSVFFEGDFFWGSVSPVNGYGNLTNVVVGPTNAGAFAGFTITPSSPSNHVHLISFDIATKDDGLGDLSFTVFVQDADNAILSSPFVSVTGDANPNTHTFVNFGGIPVNGPLGKSLSVYWPASNGRVGVDNVQFEIVAFHFISPPVILSLTGVGTTNVVLTWSAISNQIYRLLYTDDLRNNNWFSQPPDVTARGPTATATNVTDSAAQRFYRVLLLP